MEAGEVDTRKLYEKFCTLTVLFLAEVMRLEPTLEDMKRNTGNWMIATHEWGGYAYAKVCSNGKVFLIYCK